MDDLTQRIVEAGARAMWCHRWRIYMTATDDPDWADRAWPHLPLDLHNRYEGFARACLSAALALAEREDAVRKECLRTALEAVAREAQACPPGTAEVTLAVVGAIARAALAAKVTL